MFRSLRLSPEKTVSVTVNGQKISAPEGQTVWATMALCGETMTRQAAISGEARSAYCAMGVCFECLVEIDGMANQQACLRRAREGMNIETQNLTIRSEASTDDL
ncbi:(2Fe-2S)-binding protein [Phaeobacter sp. NW0010-22]|uniref:(2Fe-2S)-binding protein n=1 Tax=Phaeobacter sp. NW0010-22 TaxID=3135907 RepID=UPI000EFA9188